MNEYKIILPKNDMVAADEIASLKACLNQPKHKEMNKLFIFLYQHNPTTASEISTNLSTYYHKIYDKNFIHYHLKRLVSLGLVCPIAIMDIPDTELDSAFKELIMTKHRAFLSTLPKNFRNTYDKVIYYYVTEWGKQFIPWCCNLLGFKVTSIESKVK